MKHGGGGLWQVVIVKWIMTQSDNDQIFLIVLICKTLKWKEDVLSLHHDLTHQYSHYIIIDSLFYSLFSCLPSVGEDSWLGPQAQLHLWLPSSWCAGGRSLHQFLYLRYRLHTAVPRPHKLHAHVAFVVQSPILQRLHHVCRYGPERFESHFQSNF